jgi:hypothetical protein
VLVAVTDHAVERYRQRVAGSLDTKTEIIGRVVRAVKAGRVQERERGTLHIRDVQDRSLVFVCRRGDAEIVVVTLWEEEGGVVPPRVPRRFTDVLDKRPPRH